MDHSSFTLGICRKQKALINQTCIYTWPGTFILLMRSKYFFLRIHLALKIQNFFAKMIKWSYQCSNKITSCQGEEWKKRTRTCGDQVDLSDIQVGVHKASNPGFYLKITFLTVAKHWQVNFAKYPGNKVAQVEKLWGSVNLGAGGGCELREYNGAYSVIGFFPLFISLAPIIGHHLG